MAQMVESGDRIDWIGVDWAGGDWRRPAACAYAISINGAVLAEAQTGTAGKSALIDLIGDWLPDADAPLPVIACGGTPAPGRPAPCTPLDIDLLRPVRTDDPRVALYQIPGLRQNRPADALHGAETRIAGYLAGHPNFDGVLCLTGPRTIWARISAGEVVSFASFLSGPLFDAALTRAGAPDAVTGGTKCPAPDESGFTEALDEILSHPERLAGVLATAGLHEDNSAGARSAGALIGAELAAARPWWLGQAVAVIGGPGAAPLYAAALARQGVTATTADGRDMALAGLARARAALRERSGG
jgi:2-dehydro-3-deoxygalactonokinase